MKLVTEVVLMTNGYFSQLREAYYWPLRNKQNEMEAKYGIKNFVTYNCTQEDIELLSKESTDVLSNHIVESLLLETAKRVDDNEPVGLIIIVHHYPFRQCQFLSSTLDDLKDKVNKEFKAKFVSDNTTLAYFKEDAQLTSEHYVLKEIIALLITKPIGIYKVQVDNQYLFVVYTGQSVLIDAVLVEMNLLGTDLYPKYVISKTLTKAINGEIIFLKNKKFKDVQIVTEVDVNEFNSIKHEKLLEFKI